MINPDCEKCLAPISMSQPKIVQEKGSADSSQKSRRTLNGDVVYPDSQVATPRDITWMVATGRCQTFFISPDDHSMAVAEGGTMVTTLSANELRVKTGRMALFTHKRLHSIRTSIGNVAVRGGGTVILHETNAGNVRLTNLSGSDVSFALNDSPQDRLSVRSGEEILVAHRSIADEELIPVDGSARVEVGGTIFVSGKSVRRFAVDPKQVLARDPLFKCKICLPPGMRKRLEQMKEQIASAHSQSIKTETSNNSLETQRAISLENLALSMVPVSYTSSAKAAPSSNLSSIHFDSAEFKHCGSTNLSFERSGAATLLKGRTLVHTSAPTVIHCGDSSVSMAPGTIALINREEDIVSVENLYEGRGGSLSVQVGKRCFDLPVGQEAIFSANKSNVLLTESMRKDHLGRRNVRMVEIDNDRSIARCEVSFISLAQNVDLINQLIKSEDKYDRSIANKLIKMSACINHIHAGRGLYSPVSEK